MNLEIVDVRDRLQADKFLYARDTRGNVKLQCTRKFESAGIVLRVRALRLTGSGQPATRPTLMMAVCDRATDRATWMRYMDTLVDMVRLQNPGIGFVAYRSNYHGRRPE